MLPFLKQALIIAQFQIIFTISFIAQENVSFQIGFKINEK